MGPDDLVEPPPDRAIGFWHLRDLREHDSLLVRPVLPHRFFCSATRSFIADRSSSVNPFAEFGAPFVPGFRSAVGSAGSQAG